MSSTVTEKKQLVEEIVVALTGAPTSDTRTNNLNDQMARAAMEVDERTAGAFGKALLDSLCEDPGNVRQLEALMILGLAHPDVLRSRGISLSMEGRRLAILLDQRGEGDRARCLLDLIASKVPEEPRLDPAPPEESERSEVHGSESTEVVVEHYLKKARACVKSRRFGEAITWLQEVLLVDRSRRDVARMIRDLRYQESASRFKKKRVVRKAFLVLMLAGCVAWVVHRERGIRDIVRALPPGGGIEASDAQLESRLAGLEGVIDQYHVWVGLLDAKHEVKSRHAEIERRREKVAEAERLREAAEARKLDLAEAARLRGLMRVELGEFDLALADFAESLSLAGEGWEHRTRVQADVAALEAWKRGEH